MAQVVNTFADGSCVEFDAGSFDDWCVYFKSSKGRRAAPKDLEYFAELQKLGEKFGAEQIYADFVCLYEKSGQSIDPRVVNLIKALAATYPDENLKIEKLLTILYAGMLAEENKEHKVVGKKLKRLGLHQILIEKLTPEEAANFSKGKKVSELKAEFAKRGIR
jgi:hypothetical protein